MSVSEIIYLGPMGTFSYEVATKRFGQRGHKFISRDSVGEVCKYVAAKPSRKGIVPIDNSSGGTIYESVDALLDARLRLEIEEEITLDVKLAFVGRKRDKIEKIYTHFAPGKHCKPWIEKNYPDADVIDTDSTTAAAEQAARTPHAAAICNRIAARIYKLDVLEYPIPTTIGTNVTHFFVVSRHAERMDRIYKTSLAVHLLNTPGSLYGFLQPLAASKINLSRIVSRPIEGKPREFAFFIDVDESIYKPTLSKALHEAKKHAANVRILGSYPCFRSYRSS
jgi:chorismate mutase / prephenate dehydratase